MNITLILLAIGMLPSIFATNGGNLFNIDNCWAIYGHYTFSRTIWTLMFFFQLLLKESLECLTLSMEDEGQDGSVDFNRA